MDKGSIEFDCVESLMPKGVEHYKANNAKQAIIGCVESLMPKGVEHDSTALAVRPSSSVLNL